MSTITKTFMQVFSPPKLSENSEISFKSAVDALKLQSIARIAKAALFTLCSLAATITLVLTEASVISWPVTIPVMIISALTGLIFYRLNSLDQKYVEGLDDKTRESLAKKELERIFLSHNSIPANEIDKNLKDLNRLLGSEIFGKRAIDQILDIQAKSFLVNKTGNSEQAITQSIAEAALEQKKSIALCFDIKWTDEGRYGWSSYNRSLHINWKGSPAEPFELVYSSSEKTK